MVEILDVPHVMITHVMSPPRDSEHQDRGVFVEEEVVIEATGWLLAIKHSSVKSQISKRTRIVLTKGDIDDIKGRVFWTFLFNGIEARPAE